MGYLTKNRIVIVLALLIAFTSFPAFGQQEDRQENLTAVDGNKREPFFVINAQSSYYPSFIQVEQVVSTEPIYPYGFYPSTGYSIQLEMGLKLFNTVNVFFDFGLDDPHMSKAMEIAGKIETRYFNVIYIYKSTLFPQKTIDAATTLPGGEYDKWHFPQDGEKLASKLNVGTLALMGPVFSGFRVGFIWSSINANLGLQSEKEINGHYIAYMDIDRNFNTYGVRLALDLTDLYHLPYYTGNKGMGKLKLIGNTYIDLGWGNANLSNEAVDAVGFSSSKNLILYSVIRGNFGIAWEKGISAKRSITYGFGLDFFSTSIHFSSLKSRLVNDPAVFGIFALLGLAL
jgi:hypothetical protein